MKWKNCMVEKRMRRTCWQWRHEDCISYMLEQRTITSTTWSERHRRVGGGKMNVMSDHLEQLDHLSHARVRNNKEYGLEKVWRNPKEKSSNKRNSKQEQDQQQKKQQAQARARSTTRETASKSKSNNKRSRKHSFQCWGWLGHLRKVQEPRTITDTPWKTLEETKRKNTVLATTSSLSATITCLHLTQLPHW